MSFTIGSLFDGSGGFPLAAAMCGGTPVWASEIEPYPIAVTKTRFPNMKHLGSVTDIKGNEVEPVDVITFGSPCQDLSVAGKRAGLKHTDNGDEETTRSGLFMEAVRIIKEMRSATNGKYPRFALWENVPGAFSSNKGEDFRIVLEELIKIAEPSAVMPPVPEKGWAYSDSYCGDGWSLAYRVLDAQFWGVPQRRRRIYLVLDLGGECAGEISFEREGLRGYFTESGTPWQGIAGNAENCVGATDCTRDSVIAVDQGGGKSGANFHDNLSPTLTCTHGGEPAVAYSAVGFLRQLSGVEAQEELSPTVLAAAGMSGNNKPCVAYGISSFESNAMKSANPNSGIYEAQTSRTLDLNGGNPACNQGGIAIVEPVCFEPGIAAREGGHIYEGVCGTLRANAGDNQMAVAFCQNQREEVRDLGNVAGSLSAEQGTHQQTFVAEKIILDDQGGQQITVRTDGKSPTLRAEMHGNVPCVMDAAAFCPETGGNDPSRSVAFHEEVSPTLRAGFTPAAVYSVENHPADSRVNVDDSGKVQTLTSRMGTGGGNVPMVMEPKAIYTHPQNDTWQFEKENLVQTLSAGMGMGGGNTPLVMEPSVVEQRPTYSLETFHCVAEEETTAPLKARDYKDPICVAFGFDQGATRDVGKLWLEEQSKTLTNGTCPGHHNGVVVAIDRAYFNACQNAQYTPQTYEDGTTPTLVARGPSGVAYGVDCRNATEYEESNGALQASCNHNHNSNNVVRIQYIVRRLTPTECARLQGFPDRWATPETKDSFTDEEYEFWLNVRNTHAEINGKAVKDYTKDQMLKWYNKLHADSAEYKLWGNGIALPTALYVMQGIANVMKGNKQND